MKPKRTQGQTGARCHGKAVNTDKDSTHNQAKQKSQLSSSVRIKPFAGKVFYLDLPSNRSTEILERDIKELGGTVEKFFSKEIRYLVSSKREARYMHFFRHDSPAPSTDSGPSSPHPRSVPHRPASRAENITSKNQAQAETSFATSRGKSLVERVVKEQERVQINKILSNALEWGVKILYIDDVIAYIHKKKKTVGSQGSVAAPVKTKVRAESSSKQGLYKRKVGKISKPFIKVEDSSRHYRPIYLSMQSMPEFSLKTVAPCSPFSLEDKDPPGNKQRGHGSVKLSANEVKGQVRKKGKDKKRAGYCEGCLTKFGNLTMHLQSERHKAFAKSKEYSVVDRLISTLSYNFIPVNVKTRRPKCSVSSVIIAPGPCKPTETVAEETMQNAEGCALSHLRTTSPADSTPHDQRCQRNRYTYSHSSKQKYLARKRPCRQNPETFKPEDGEEASQCKSDTAPPSGDVFNTLPSRVGHVELLNQKPFKHENSSTSHTCDESLRRTSNDREHSQSKAGAIPLYSIHNKKQFPDKRREMKLSEQEEESSPVQKLKRKIRVYKQKRRKVDTSAEHAASVLKLWECFQSSDDMDLEFCGFEDEELANDFI